jgi:hypothetical protein
MDKKLIEIKSDKLIKEAKVSNIARLAKMLVDLFGSNEPFKNVSKYNNREIELYLSQYDRSITFLLTNERKNFDCRLGGAGDPIARITLNVEEDKILKVLSNIIRSKNNLWSIIKLGKYLIPGKIKIKGSYKAAILLVRCLMIGNHKVYK